MLNKLKLKLKLIHERILTRGTSQTHARTGRPTEPRTDAPRLQPSGRADSARTRTRARIVHPIPHTIQDEHSGAGNTLTRVRTYTYTTVRRTRPPARHATTVLSSRATVRVGAHEACARRACRRENPPQQPSSRRPAASRHSRARRWTRDLRSPELADPARGPLGGPQLGSCSVSLAPRHQP